MSTEITYNLSRRISTIIHKNKDNSLIEKYQYKYDPNGNRIQIDKITSEETFSTFYKYDSLNRVIEAKYSNGFFEIFTYDKRGNRLSKKTPDKTINYEYNKAGLLLKAGDTQFFYDDKGNLIRKCSPTNTAKYTYNADNLLISYIDDFNKVEFEYDAFGNRISKVVNGLKTEYVNDLSSSISQVLFERFQEDFNSEEKIIKYTYGGSRINQSCNEKTQFYLYDSIGRNVSSLIDFSGNILNRYEYESFGSIYLEGGKAQNTYKFCSEQLDVETGLIYLRNRYYDPEIGRFITKDKRLGDLKKPQTLNKYVYVENNPINFIDPLGFASMSPEEKEHVILHVNYRCGYLGGQGMGGHVFLEFPKRKQFFGSYPGFKERNESRNIHNSTFSIGCDCVSNQVTEALKVMDSINWTFNKNCAYTAVEGMKAMGFKHAEKVHFPMFSALPMPKELKNQMLKFYKQDKEGLVLYTHKKPSFLETIFSPVYQDALDYGGVSLSKKAEVQLNLLDITGATFDKNSGQIILFGKEDHLLPKVDIDDLVVAVRSIYGIGLNNPQDPGVSIGTEKSDKPGQMKVRYDGATENTSFGKIMFEADRLLKCLILGKDNITGKSFTSNVAGFKSVHDRLGKKYEGHFEHRIWLVPGNISLIASEDGKSVVFNEVKMQALTEVQLNGNKTDFLPCINFAKHLTAHYDKYAKEFPILKKLKDLGKITAIVKWLKESQIPFDLSFFINYQPKYIKTPKYTPRSTRIAKWETFDVENGKQYSYTRTFITSGGILYKLDQKNFNFQKDVLVDRFSSSILRTRPSENDFKWCFHSPINCDPLSAIAYSICRTKKPGNIKKYYVDMALPISQDVQLEVGRFYNSFYEEDSYLGYGWKILPYEITLPLQRMEITIQDEKINTFSHILVRIFDTEDFYELMEIKEGFPIFKSKTSEYYLRDNLDDTYVLCLANDNIVAVFDKLGRVIETTNKDVSIFYEYNLDKLMKMYSSKGQNIDFQYENNKIIKAKASNGKSIDFVYNAKGLLEKVINNKQSMHYFYDRDKRLNKILDNQKNIVFVAEYDDYNRATKVYEEGNQYDFTYSLEQRFIKITSGPEEIFLQFDEENKMIQKMEGNKIYKYFYEQEDVSLPTRIVDDNNNTLEIEYNSNGQITFFKNALGAVWKFIYDTKGNLLVAKYPNGRAILYSYNLKNNLDQVALNVDVEFVEDKVKFNYKGDSIVFYHYDKQTNRLKSISKINGGCYSYGYDENGYPNKIRMPTGYALEKIIDNEGKVLEIKDRFGVEVIYKYDENGYLKKIIAKDGESCFLYEDGNLIKATDPSNNVSHYAYDKIGNLVKVIDSEGNIFNYAYTENNELLRIDYLDGYVENF